MLIFHRALAAMFGASGNMFFPALVCFCIYIPFYMNGTLFVSWYTAIRRVKIANIVTLAQDMVLPPLLAALFSLIGGNAIWLHLPTTGVLVAILLPLLAALVGGRDKNASFPLLLDANPGGTTLAFSVERDAVKASEASDAVGEFCEEQGLPMKQTMLLSLAIEELITLIAEQRAVGGGISVRLTFFEGGTVLRFRDTGQKFNPIDFYKESLDNAGSIEDSVGLLGVKYIIEAAEVVYYRETFGVNSLVVII
jgi:anti-sigma regulatory factor (Ser/Thr protein kinase)